MELATAFLLGLLGSLHCAGMCGPLALALPPTGHTSRTLLLGRFAYNGGRIVTYMLLGVLFGSLGQGLAWAGWQRWLSIAAGVAILIGALASTKVVLGLPAIAAVGKLKSAFGWLLKQRTVGSVFLLGTLNGLLPCGLVYAACAGATATGSVAVGALFMGAFGLGTVPMMLGLSLAGPRLQAGLRFKLQRLIPVGLTIVGVLLVLRGLELGIPYVSPAANGHCPACH